ncbi:MAG: MFS transporter [Propioniciclava sp.]|uniref:MFS transporter n=1 Tax=Propioniciclava sp. TaxID=2038686 RepID=UPI0039E4BF9E
MRRTFASLAVGNYRRWFLGGLTSNIGTWMMRTALSWLVLVELTPGNMSALGLVTGLQFVPSLLLSVWAGTLADRFSKRRIMAFTQTMQLLDSLVLGLLVVSGHAQLWHVFAIALLDGTATAIDAPARQAFASELVEPEMLGNAISLNSTSFNGARLVGPGLGGILIAAAGSTGPVFLLNAVSFIVLLVMLARMDAGALHRSPRVPRGKGHLTEGIRYVASRPDLKLLLAVGFVMGNFGFNFAITNPIMTTAVFSRGATELGLVGTLMGLGALAGALTAASRRRPRLRYLLAAQAGFSAFSLASALAPSFWVFALLMIPIGFCAITTLVTANTLVQSSLDAAVRGRVMALWALLIMGGTPIVGPLVGWIGEVAGPRMTVMVGVIGVGAMAVASTWWVMRSDHLKVRMAWEGARPHWVVIRELDEDVDDPHR